MKSSLVIFLIIIYVNVASQVVVGVPLSTNSRWIVDETGARVKLACVNWPSHLEPVLVEGLHKKPLGEISKSIAATGFNCVRLTWPLELPTNSVLASTSVEARLNSFGLNDAIDGIRDYNPEFLELPLLQAFQKVVKELGDNNLTVILDNHLSRPGWCCSDDDGNGFFGDRYFEPQVWLDGLTQMASLFNNSGNVVGMSLRNELRGPDQNPDDWYRYMQQGAEAVHKANPNVLVVVSGLSFDTSFSFLKKDPLKLSFTNKLVFEVHRYAYTNGREWETGWTNRICGRFTKHFLISAGFVLEQGFPLLLSEFGADLRGTNINDNRFLNCMFGVLADLDMDWAWWTLQGSYYLREGVKDMDEVYGLYNKAWNGHRNTNFMVRLRSIQIPYQGPVEEVKPYNIIYHSSSGLCVLTNPSLGLMKLGLCEASTAWIGDGTRKTITLSGTNSCLQVVGMKQPIRLGTNCSGPSSKWEMIPGSKLQLSSELDTGEKVCMDVNNAAGGIIVSNPCTCLEEDPECDSGKQWFKIISSTRKPLVPRAL